jgi:hypothetical protein
MSETAPKFEHDLDSPEHEKNHEHHEKLKETPESSVEHIQVKHEAPLDLEKIRETVEKEGEHVEIHAAEVEKEEPRHIAPPDTELRKVTLNNTMARIRRQLPGPEKTFSKVIHQPVIDKVSEITGKTIFRPIGFMLGAMIGLVGSSVVLFLSRHYGFKYNYITFFAFFIIGLVLGMVLEILARLMRISSSKD